MVIVVGEKLLGGEWRHNTWWGGTLPMIWKPLTYDHAAMDIVKEIAKFYNIRIQNTDEEGKWNVHIQTFDRYYVCGSTKASMREAIVEAAYMLVRGL